MIFFTTLRTHTYVHMRIDIYIYIHTHICTDFFYNIVLAACKAFDEDVYMMIPDSIMHQTWNPKQLELYAPTAAPK